MVRAPIQSYCWTPIWNPRRAGTGMEHLLLGDQSADSVVLAYDEDDEPFRLTYRLEWDDAWRIRSANLAVADDAGSRSLALLADGQGHWKHASGQPIDSLDGCLDIDIWPTPFTNTFPLRRRPMNVGERCEFAVAWISAPELTIHRRRQAYTRKGEHLYLFESLGEDAVRADLAVDENLIVIDYPGLFRRLDPTVHPR